MRARSLLIFAALTLLVGCNQAAEDAALTTPTMEPDAVAARPSSADALPGAVDMPQLSVGAGTYLANLDHSTLGFHIRHMGMSNYVARFTDYEVKVDYVPNKLSASSVSVTIDPTSLGLDFYGDFKVSHPDSPYSTFIEELMGDKFFDAAQYPGIEFHSTHIESTGPGTFSITGDLTLHGQTHPVTFNATVVGAQADHPMYGGIDVFGMSASGSFSRSEFGMDYLVAPGVVGDKVTLMFEGEFLEQKPPAAATSAAESPEPAATSG